MGDTIIIGIFLRIDWLLKPIAPLDLLKVSPISERKRSHKCSGAMARDKDFIEEIVAGRYNG